MGIIARLLFDCAASAFEVRRSPPGPILVVDDDPDLLEMVGLVLESAGYAVLPAMNGIEALRRVQEGHPALILLDMKMPLMDGWEFMARYRQLHNHQSPVIILTAAQDARAWAEQVQADGYLAKPFDIADLLNIVDKHIRGARTGGGN
ncbi:MAG: response regulator [Chloroflexota bacterium]|nr:MAG: response regulator [Chloroflexota bacterium]